MIDTIEKNTDDCIILSDTDDDNWVKCEVMGDVVVVDSFGEDILTPECLTALHGWLGRHV